MQGATLDISIQTAVNLLGQIMGVDPENSYLFGSVLGTTIGVSSTGGDNTPTVHVGDDVVESGGNFIELSQNNIQHIKKHTFDGIAEQAKYLTDEQLAAKLSKTTFFNKNWSLDEVIMYTQEAYNALRQQGKTGLQSIEINGEIINVFIKEDGTFDTAYGNYTYTVDDFREE